jgi:hypothetical protein
MADQPPPPAPPPPPPGYVPSEGKQRRRGRGCLIPLAILGGLVLIELAIAAVAGGGDDDGGETATGGGNGDGGLTEAEEVTITECGPPDEIGVVYVTGVASNTSSERSEYLIEVVVEDADGNQIGTGGTVAENVEPDQRARWQAITDTPHERWVDDARCRVADVERNASV